MNETDWKRGDRCTVVGRRQLPGLPMVARVMAVAEGYAMLRYPHCAPFIASVKDLEPEP